MNENVNNDTPRITCMEIYDMHSFCINHRNQLSNLRRYGSFQSCDGLFQDWKKCMIAKITGDPQKKQVKRELLLFHNFIVFI